MGLLSRAGMRAFKAGELFGERQGGLLSRAAREAPDAGRGGARQASSRLFRGENPNATRSRFWDDDVEFWTDNPRMASDFAQSGPAAPDVEARAIAAIRAFDEAFERQLRGAPVSDAELAQLARARDAAMKETWVTSGFVRFDAPPYQNPMVIDRGGRSVPDGDMLGEIRAARSAGHDAVVWENGIDGATGPSEPSRVVATFSRKQRAPDGGAA